MSDLNYSPIPSISLDNYKSPQTREGQNENLSIGLAISGGGSRAEYFGFGVLIGLDEIAYTNKEKSSFLNEVDYISTVSGGGLGAGYYLSLKKHQILEDYDNLLSFWNSEIRIDSLSSYLFESASLLNLFKLKRLERTGNSKFPGRLEYEVLQEGKWYKNKKIDRLFLGNFFIEKKSTHTVELPMFVVNGTIFNNNERIPFMPHIVNSLEIDGALMPYEPFKNINNGFGFPLNHAMVSSNSFPGILPIPKYSVKGSDEVIRIVDGGVVENFGYKTLFELLNADKNNIDKKRALIVDCSGEIDGNQYEENKRIKITKLLPSALFYTLSTRYLPSNENIHELAVFYDFDTENIKRIGFSTLKEKFLKERSKANPTALNDLKIVKDMLIKERVKKNGKQRSIRKRNKKHLVSKELVRRLNEINGNKNFNGQEKEKVYDTKEYSNIPTAMFSHFTLAEIFLLYELSVQVQTKLKIYPWEKEILVLAGRYAVYLEKENLKKLLD